MLPIVLAAAVRVGLQVLAVRLAASGAGLFPVIAVSAVAGGCSARSNLGSGRDGDTGRVPGGAVFLGGPDRPSAVHTGLFAESAVPFVPGLGSAFGRRLGAGLRCPNGRRGLTRWLVPLGTVSGCRGRSGGCSQGTAPGSRRRNRRRRCHGGRRLAGDRCGGTWRLEHEGHAEASTLAGSAGAPDLVLHPVGYRPAQALSSDRAMGAGGLRGLYAITGRVEDLGGHVDAQRAGGPVGLWKVGAAGTAHGGLLSGVRQMLDVLA